MPLCMVSVQVRFVIKSGLWWRSYSKYIRTYSKSNVTIKFTKKSKRSNDIVDNFGTYRSYLEYPFKLLSLIWCTALFPKTDIIILCFELFPTTATIRPNYRPTYRWWRSHDGQKPVKTRQEKEIEFFCNFSR